MLSSSGLTRGSRLDPRLRGDDTNVICIDFSKVAADSVESPTGRNLEIAVENNCAVGLIYGYKANHKSAGQFG